MRFFKFNWLKGPLPPKPSASKAKQEQEEECTRRIEEAELVKEILKTPYYKFFEETLQELSEAEFDLWMSKRIQEDECRGFLLGLQAAKNIAPVCLQRGDEAQEQMKRIAASNK